MTLTQRKTSTETRYRIVDTAIIDPFVIIVDGDGTVRSTWLRDGRSPDLRPEAREDRRLLADLFSRLRAYFRGEIVDFSDIATPSGSPFFERCWNACRAIPHGSVVSYGQLAAAAGRPNAARAAGQSMRRNPLPIIVPCHRVVAADGALHGFGGTCEPTARSLQLKRALLELEGAFDETATTGRIDTRRRPLFGAWP